MDTITEKYHQLLTDIRNAESMAKRMPDSVKLLAVSKGKPAHDLISVYQAGQRHFGESYLQEALRKQRELAHFNITWHFIGPIQSNKTRLIAQNFCWVHSVDRLKIARRLSEQRPEKFSPLNICLQVNISGEPSKSGVLPDEIPSLIESIKELPRLRLRGVMAIPAPETDCQKQRLPYRKLMQTLREFNISGLDTFSMGMSGDLKAAITEGATLVRIGSALFGSRS